MGWLIFIGIREVCKKLLDLTPLGFTNAILFLGSDFQQITEVSAALEHHKIVIIVGWTKDEAESWSWSQSIFWYEFSFSYLVFDCKRVTALVSLFARSTSGTANTTLELEKRIGLVMKWKFLRFLSIIGIGTIGSMVKSPEGKWELAGPLSQIQEAGKSVVLWRYYNTFY